MYSALQSTARSTSPLSLPLSAAVVVVAVAVSVAVVPYWVAEARINAAAIKAVAAMIRASASLAPVTPLPRIRPHSYYCYYPPSCPPIHARVMIIPTIQRHMNDISSILRTALRLIR